MTKHTSLGQSEIKKRLSSYHAEIDNWESLHRVLGTMSDTAWIFRGVSSPDHYPIPSIGREKIYGHYKRAQEERLLQEFKHRAVLLMNGRDFDDWHWLAFAQHLGVPTRLLDWTLSPLIAAFFALQGESDTDRAIYCVKYSRFIHEVDRIGLSPFDCKSGGRFTPPLIFERLRAQRGLFTFHPEPTKIFWHHSMRVLRIAQSSVDTLRKRLFKYGIDHWYIYPDAEGLGQQMRWQYRNKIGLGSLFMPKAGGP